MTSLGWVGVCLAAGVLLASLAPPTVSGSPRTPAAVPPGKLIGHPLSAPFPTYPRTAVSGAQGRMIVSTTDPLAMPNYGLRLNLSPFLEPPLQADSSFQAAASETIGDHDAVFGLFANTNTAPVPFFSVFSNVTDVSEHLAYWPTASPLPRTSYDFELTPVNGTVWELDVNGAMFGGNASDARFDFGATSATWLGGLSFSEIALYPAQTSVPSICTAPVAFAVREAAGWYLPTEAHATFSTGGGSPWGIEGRVQHPTLAPGVLVSGTSVAAVTNGTELWTTGPVPVDVSLALPPTAQSLTPYTVTVTVTTPLGAGVPGATVYVRDLTGGNATPESVVTGNTGTVDTVIEPPNVSASSTDTVQANVTTFGYLGSTHASVLVTPAVQVFVRPGAASRHVAPGGALLLSFTTLDGKGTVWPNVFLTIGTTGGVLDPQFGYSGADGSFATTLTAPNATGYVTIEAVVGGAGLWGSALVNVSVEPPAGPWWSGPIGTGLAVAGAVAVAAVIAVWAWRRRPRARPIPPMRLPRRRTLPVAPPPSPPAEAPPTRTPP